MDSSGARCDPTRGTTCAPGPDPESTGAIAGSGSDGDAPADDTGSGDTGGACGPHASGPTCVCDEGFIGDLCDGIGPDFHARTLLVPGLADPETLGRTIETVFDGACTPDAAVIPVGDIQTFRVCSAVGGDWANATCGSSSYDGTEGFVDVALPP